MVGSGTARKEDVLAIFENWLLKRRSEGVFRLTHPCAALDAPSIVHYEDGGILTIRINILKRTDRTENRIIPASKVAAVTFHDEPPSNPPERAVNCKYEYPIRSSLTRRTCPECRGEKKRVCQECFGKKKEMCRSCLEERVLRVKPNRTRSEPPEGNKSCPLCKGSGLAPCFRCGGVGSEPCSTCRGEDSVYIYKTVIHDHRARKSAIRVTSEDDFTQTFSKDINGLANSSKFDVPLRFVDGKIVPAYWMTRSESLKKYLDSEPMELAWPLTLEEFLSTTGIRSSGLSLLFKKAREEYLRKTFRVQGDDKIVRAHYSAEFVPVSHLIFSNTERYDRQFHFSLIGTSEGYTILPPKLSSAIVSPNTVLWLPFLVGGFGTSFLALSVFFCSAVSLDCAGVLLYILIFIMMLVTISAIPMMYRIPSVIYDTIFSKWGRKESPKRNTSTKKVQMRQTSRNTGISNNHLILLAGPDTLEKSTFFCLLNLELCRRRSITISDPWIHRMLAIFLDAELPHPETSLPCHWEIPKDGIHESSKKGDLYPKETGRKMESGCKGQNAHFLSVPASFFHWNKQQDKLAVYESVNAIIFLYSPMKANALDGSAIQGITDEILGDISVIASAQNVKPENVPIFILFNDFERDVASEVISVFNQKKIKPHWEMINVNSMKKQYLEGQFEKYENFITTSFEFIILKGIT